MQFFSTYHCVQLEDSFIWVHTCSCDCILTIKICVSWLLLINFTHKMQEIMFVTFSLLQAPASNLIKNATL